ncbi:BZ3500_MvSof-1268-A1-R1_Chr2-2g04912 [Microbotryum saponariae]|uniref:BZ3500_MvSof-1268-A1-R1_Chr2-2g04912 protein n=1 Tax=Microbotryum saponariae TaxID=289078 RepID=A0A2X0KAD9_9BASI|nr:BZ3500_MvSof-1268-A1-R1_Chr2-2g04912 [Microbotryum saponariae]SDA00462.1 BZ3501_MvSof-1269-A2-R1_Chr2-2g04586 [Microbotryum saponariae]
MLPPPPTNLFTGGSSSKKFSLNLYDSDFRCYPPFPFTASIMLRRRDVFRNLAFRIPKQEVARIAGILLGIDQDMW